MADQDRDQQQAEGAQPQADGGELSGNALESAAGGVIGVDTDGDGIIDQSCTDIVICRPTWRTPLG